MDLAALLEIVTVIGAIFTALFATYRFSLTQSGKRETAFLDFIKAQNERQLEYFTVKNGHMEKMAKDFTTSSNKMAKAIQNLTNKINIKQ